MFSQNYLRFWADWLTTKLVTMVHSVLQEKTGIIQDQLKRPWCVFLSGISFFSVELPDYHNNTMYNQFESVKWDIYVIAILVFFTESLSGIDTFSARI